MTIITKAELANVSDDDLRRVASPEYVRLCKLVMTLRGMGASIRSIAKAFGYNKSSLHRDMALIERVSQLGQPETQTSTENTDIFQR